MSLIDSFYGWMLFILVRACGCVSELMFGFRFWFFELFQGLYFIRTFALDYGYLWVFPGVTDIIVMMLQCVD